MSQVWSDSVSLSLTCSHKSTWWLDIGACNCVVHHNCVLSGCRAILSNSLKLMTRHILLVHWVRYGEELVLSCLQRALQQTAHFFVQSSAHTGGTWAVHLQVLEHICVAGFDTFFRILVKIVHTLNRIVWNATHIDNSQWGWVLDVLQIDGSSNGVGSPPLMVLHGWLRILGYSVVGIGLFWWRLRRCRIQIFTCRWRSRSLFSAILFHIEITSSSLHCHLLVPWIPGLRRIIRSSLGIRRALFIGRPSILLAGVSAIARTSATATASSPRSASLIATSTAAWTLVSRW